MILDLELYFTALERCTVNAYLCEQPSSLLLRYLILKTDFITLPPRLKTKIEYFTDEGREGGEGKLIFFFKVPTLPTRREHLK